MTYFDIADVPLGFNHVARFIVDVNHSIIYTTPDRRSGQRLLLTILPVNPAGHDQLNWQRALVKAKELTADISVSVCDAYGHLVAHQRMDNVFIDAIRESIGKAVAAAESGSPSGGTVRENAYYPLTGMVVASGVPDIRSRGGLPVIRGGKLESAIGASGAQTDEQDEECARAGVEALIGDG